MENAGEGSRATRREVLGATAGALAVGALPGRSSAQQASGPTVYVGSFDGTLYAVDAATGSQEWAFTQPSRGVDSSPTVVDGTVYVGSYNDTLYAVDAATGEQEWAFTQPSDRVFSSPTVVADPESGDSVGSRVLLGTLGHHTSSDDDGASGDDSGSSDDGGSGDGGLGTTEMAAVGGGGSLALLFGAYALMRRVDDDAEDETTPDRPSEPDTPGRATTGSTGSQSPDNGTEDTIGDLLDDVAGTLDSARQSRDSGEFDRALAHCREAIETAKEARAIAREDAPGRVPDAEAALDDATALQEAINDERDARQRAGDALNTVEDMLNDAATALNSDTPQEALDYLDDVRGTLDTARVHIEDGEFPTLADRLAALEQRHERLQQDAEDAITRIPTSIPTTPRHSLSYADIEKGESVGRGGNADVYYATAATDSGSVELALKEPRMSGTLHVETVERLLKEAETWQQLDSHDHIVSVIDYGSEPLPWIAMEYIDAGHLGERVGDLAIEQALWTAIATTKAVRHAHRRGVAHLDLKPQNVLFRSVEDAWDVPKVADWGLSKQLLEHSKSVEGMSPHYAAPEQFDSDKYGGTDDITDVYQLGAVFYELFTGQPPFEGKTFEVINKIQSETPTPPSELADVPPELDDILLTALATEKADRYETVIYLRDDLQDVFDSL